MNCPFEISLPTYTILGDDAVIMKVASKFNVNNVTPMVKKMKSEDNYTLNNNDMIVDLIFIMKNWVE